MPLVAAAVAPGQILVVNAAVGRQIDNVETAGRISGHKSAWHDAANVAYASRQACQNIAALIVAQSIIVNAFVEGNFQPMRLPSSKTETYRESSMPRSRFRPSNAESGSSVRNYRNGRRQS
jgi:hypothetical protein